jgi:hypothetical protein
MTTLPFSSWETHCLVGNQMTNNNLKNNLNAIPAYVQGAVRNPNPVRQWESGKAATVSIYKKSRVQSEHSVLKMTIAF